MPRFCPRGTLRSTEASLPQERLDLVKELVAGIALVGLASVSKSRSGGALSGSDDYHRSKAESSLLLGWKILTSKSYGCEEKMRNAVLAYGHAVESLTHLESSENPDGLQKDYRDSAIALKNDATFEISENSCYGDSSRLRRQQTGRY